MDYTVLPNGRVRYLRPGLWALAVSTGIVVGCAYLEAKKQIKEEKKKKNNSWPQLPQILPTPPQGPPRSLAEVATRVWTKQNEMMKVSVSLTGANLLVHASRFVVPRFWDTLWHLPVRNVNYTQFTCIFVHSGAIHLGFNVFAINNFIAAANHTPVFESSPHHIVSFYLAAGVLSTFVQHLATLIPPPAHRKAVPEIFVRCGGASGALFAIFGLVCTQFPTAGLKILMLPFRFEAQYVLPALILFDFVGMVRPYKIINIGHAAHLSGTLIGVAYSYFDGKNNLWNPLVRCFKRQLQESS